MGGNYITPKCTPDWNSVVTPDAPPSSEGRFIRATPRRVIPDPDLKSEISFGQALAALKSGSYVSRTGWNGADMWLGLQRPDEHSKMSLPYIFMCTAQGDLVPWLASNTDLLSNDWFVLADV